MVEDSLSTKKRVTLRDIAHQANVSTSTVSRVLNNYPYVDETTRLVVREAAQTLNYPLENLRRVPDMPRMITLLTRETDQGKGDALAGFDQRAARGAQSVFESRDIVTYVRHVRMHPDEVDVLVDESDSDGLILLGGKTSKCFVRRLQEQGVHFVIAGAHVQPLQANCVMADVRAGMEAGIQHLIDRGRKRIGLVNGPDTTNTSREKFNALRLMLHLHDLAFVPEQVVIGDFEPEIGYEQTLRLIEQKPDLDAIVYADDSMAMGGLRALKRQGYRIPDDIAVVGFHGYEITRFTDPPLTSIEFDMEAMGRIAARRLLMMLDEADDEHWLTLVPTSLVVREST